MCLNYQNDQLSSNDIQCNPKEKTYWEFIVCYYDRKYNDQKEAAS